jgi:hypothetical protein
MKRYLPQIVCLLCLLLGLSAGWYLGYTRPSVTDQRRILAEYRQMRDAFKLSDQEMAELGAQLPRMREQMERSDEFAAAIALAAFTKLEQGDVERAKWRLTGAISAYYRGHRFDGESNFVARIERFATTNAALSNAIYGKLE